MRTISALRARQALKLRCIPASPLTSTRALHVGGAVWRIRPSIPVNPYRGNGNGSTSLVSTVRQFGTFQQVDSTIYALSTAPGRAAIAIIRISGPACLRIYRALCPGKTEPKPRQATVRALYNPDLPPSRETTLDSNALILYFPSPRTVTGEDVLELHVHGGPAVVKAILAAIPRCGGGIRYAEPGEFTKRAFLNSRLDLTQVEALGDILSATTEQQRRLSVRGTTNNLAKRYDEWRHQLLYARGELEALIDFSEDQHFDESPAELCASVAVQVSRLGRLIQAHSRNAVRGEMLRNGIAISLLGAPNAGKSSLLNCVVGREAAIVSHEAGTTRDVVEVGLDVGGYFCRLGDTAGLRQASLKAGIPAESSNVIGMVEEEGMRRAKERAAESDVVIVVLSLEETDGSYYLHLDPEVTTTAANLVSSKNNILIAINKADRIPNPAARTAAVHAVLAALPGISPKRIHLISCKDAIQPSEPTSQDPGNIQAFLHGLISHFDSLTAAVVPDGEGSDIDPSIWQDSLGASERHRLLLDKCLTSLDAFLAEVNTNDSSTQEADIVLAAEHLRTAASCLAKITGKGEAGDVEDVLGVVFEKFCVGK